jgi:hypothetical protein
VLSKPHLRQAQKRWQTFYAKSIKKQINMKKTFLFLTFILLFSCKNQNGTENKSLEKNDTIQNEKLNESEKSISDEKSEKITEYLNKYIIDNVLYRHLIEQKTDEFGDKVNELMVCKAECKFSSQTNTLTVLNEYHKDYKYRYILNGDTLRLIDNNNEEINYKIIFQNYGVVFVADKTFKFKTSDTNPFVYDIVGFVIQNKELYSSYSQLPTQIK